MENTGLPQKSVCMLVGLFLSRESFKVKKDIKVSVLLLHIRNTLYFS